MKKFFILLLVLLMIPVCSFATESPTMKAIIRSNPSLNFMLAEITNWWPGIVKRIEEYNDIEEDYILLDAIYLDLKIPYDRVEWTLTIPVMTEHEPFILIISSKNIVKQEVSITEDGKVITDFSECSLGAYFICFYIKDV